MRDLGQIRKAAHLGRVVFRHDHDRQIAREDHGIDNQSPVCQKLHVLPVGRGEHVRLRALFNLHAQILAAGEIEADPGIWVLLLENQCGGLEDLAQRRGRKHHQFLCFTAACPNCRKRRNRARGNQCDKSNPAVIHAWTPVGSSPVRAVR